MGIVDRKQKRYFTIWYDTHGGFHKYSGQTKTPSVTLFNMNLFVHTVTLLTTVIMLYDTEFSKHFKDNSIIITIWCIALGMSY